MKKLIAIIFILSLLPMTAFANFTLYGKTIKLPNGLRMCALKHDKPHKSFVHHKKHLDRECCLDPGEIPNPLCFYGVKYNKFL